MNVSEGLELRVTADREGGAVSDGMPLGLVLEVTALGEHRSPRRPVNLGLVIDCSGSMGGWRLQAAKSATLDIIDGLREGDSLSIVGFGKEAEVHFSTPSMTPAARHEALAAVEKLRTRGSTNLAEGYFVGAECVNEYLQACPHGSGMIVLLTDGKANRGVTSPHLLGQKASELLRQGITTSAVGVGPDYSPRQIAALADAGGGRLHHCDHAEDIVDVILSEFGEAAEAAFLDSELSIRWPDGLDVRLLGYQGEKLDPTALKVSLGDLRSGVKRKLAAIVTANGSASQALRIILDLSWRSERNGFGRRSATAHFELISAGWHTGRRDLDVVAEVASRWEASMAYAGALLNEERRYEEASSLYNIESLGFVCFVEGLPDARQRVRRLKQASRRFARPWAGSKKNLLMDLARKQARSEVDTRRDPKGPWHDKL